MEEGASVTEPVGLEDLERLISGWNGHLSASGTVVIPSVPEPFCSVLNAFPSMADQLVSLYGVTECDGPREALSVLDGWRDELKELRRIVALGRKIKGAGYGGAPGDGVWLDLSAWEAFEEAVNGRVSRA